MDLVWGYLCKLLLGNVSYLLRCSWALDGRLGEGEDSVSGPEVLDSLERLVDVLGIVVCAYLRQCVQCFFQSFDCAVIDLSKLKDLHTISSLRQQSMAILLPLNLYYQKYIYTWIPIANTAYSYSTVVPSSVVTVLASGSKATARGRNHSASFGRTWAMGLADCDICFSPPPTSVHMG